MTPGGAPPFDPFVPRRLEIGAGHMSYVDEGAGPPVLFVHGTPTWSFDWRRLIRTLAPTHRCVAPDLIGFGHSDRPRDFAYTPEAHAVALAEFVERLGLERFTLVVHDFGGPIGLPLALRDPSPVARVVVLNSWMWSLAGDAYYERGARVIGSPLGRFLYRWANLSIEVITPSAYGDRRKLTPEIHRALRERFPDRWSRGAVLWTLAKSLLGSSDHYESLWQRRSRLRRLPALIVWGMRDPAFPPRLLDRWSEALPQAKLVQLADAGHWPHEEEPERVATELAAFLGASAHSRGPAQT